MIIEMDPVQLRRIFPRDEKNRSQDDGDVNSARLELSRQAGTTGSGTDRSSKEQEEIYIEKTTWFCRSWSAARVTAALAVK